MLQRTWFTLFPLLYIFLIVLFRSQGFNALIKSGLDEAEVFAYGFAAFFVLVIFYFKAH